MTTSNYGAVLFALGGSDRLAAAVADCAGVELGKVEEREFERGEHKTRLLTDVGNREVGILHCVHGDPTGFAAKAGASVNDRLLRLWLFTAAVRDAGARSIVVVVPYLPYARKDRRTKARDPVGSRYIAEHFEVSGTDRLITLEPHNLAAFDNAFRIPAIALPFAPMIEEWLKPRVNASPLVIVSPDVGGAKRAQDLQGLLIRRGYAHTGLAFVEKRRTSDVLTVGRLVGDVNGAHCLVIDDLISSGRTIAHAAAVCRAAGAYRLSIAAAHALFEPEAVALGDSGIDALLVSDSVPVDPHVASRLPIQVLPLAPYLGSALHRLWCGGSITDLMGIED